MITETKHTPLPWRVNGTIDTHGGFRSAWIEPNISEMVSSRPPDEVTANARFIVTACNNYERILTERDELAGALRYVLLHVGKHEPTDFKQTLPMTWPEALRQARAVLAKIGESK